MTDPAGPGGLVDAGKDGYALVFAEDFTGGVLDDRKWVAHYLPHWTTPNRSAARYDLQPGWLRLRIDADQPAWLPDGEQLRVSNLQTGSFSGPVGSPRGQHRHRLDLTVVSAQPTRRLYTPTDGLVQARLRASADPTCMLAVWLVGFEEDAPDQCGEICIAELYGQRIGPTGSAVRLGIKAHHDPRLRDDMTDVQLGLDATDWHSYAAAWDAHQTRLYVDNQLVRTVPQGLDYPLQLMIDLFEFPPDEARDPSADPKTSDVGPVRGYRPLPASS